MQRPRSYHSSINSINWKLYAIIGVAVLIVVGAILLLTIKDDTTQAKSGEIKFNMDSSSIIVRDEKLYEAENYGKAEFVAAEGQYVSKGDIIAEVYKWGYNDKIADDLADIQQKITEYQQKNLLKDVLNKDLESLNQSIAKKTSEICDAISNKDDGASDLLKLQRDLENLMEERRTFLKNSVVVDTQLSEFYNQEETTLAKIDSLKQTIIAANEGVVSFYFDGCEQLLTPDNIKKLTVQNINDVTAGRTTMQLEGKTARRPLYRMVSPYKWYVLLISDQKIAEFYKGNELKLIFDGNKEKKYTGVCMGARKDSSKYIYGFEINEDISDLVNVRISDITLSKDYSGIKIPSSCIKEEKKQKGVFIRHNSTKLFVPIDVLITQEGQSIVRPKNSDAPFKAGSTIYK